MPKVDAAAHKIRLNGREKLGTDNGPTSAAFSHMSSTRQKRTSSNNLPAKSLTASILPELSCFGPKPLLENESEQDFDELWTGIRNAVEPIDFIEEIWCRDVVDTLWEALRLRRWKTSLLKSMRYSGMRELLKVHYGSLELKLETDMMLWAGGDLDVAAEFDALLKPRGLDQYAVDAATMAANLSEFEKIDAMLMRIEARRHMTMQEMTRRREFKHRIQQAVHVKEAEFTDITAGTAVAVMPLEASK